MNPGLKAPYFRVYHKDDEITPHFSSLKYTYDEEGDDECTLTVRTSDRNFPDKPYCQEKAELKIIWGYIDGKISGVRKVYIMDLKWSFDQELVTGTISASEKGVSLKHTSSNEIYKNKTLPEIVTDKANKHGLTPILEVPPEPDVEIKLIPNPGETLNEFLVRENREKQRIWLEKNKDNKSQRINLRDALDARSKDPYFRMVDSIAIRQNTGGTFNPNNLLENKVKFRMMADKFMKSVNSPQANKTDKQYMVEQGKRQANGPYLIETRDEELILKKRNFIQKPYKAYTFGGPEGELLSFSPESKNRSKSGSGVTMGFSGWDARNKTFFTGETAANTLSPSLAKFVEMAKFYAKQQKRGLGGLVVGSRTTGIRGFIGAQNFNQNIDNSGNYRIIPVEIPITVNDTVKALKDVLSRANQRQREKYKEMFNALGVNPEDAYNTAENTRLNNELKKNPASATLEGDPDITTGKVITIVGISQKYSGNYYITKCTHTIEPNSHYEVELELHRQGNNLKANENHLPAADVGRKVNTQEPDNNKKKSKQLPIKTN